MTTGRPFDDASAPMFTVGQVADMLQVQPAFLRRLDDQGVVEPARSGGNQRRYSRDQMDRIDEVRDMVGDGLTLAGIRRVLELQARIAELEAEVGDLRRRLGDPGPDRRTG